MYLFLYNMNYQFGQIAGDVQVRQVDIDNWQPQGGVAAGSALIVYWGAVCMPYQTEGGGILFQRR